MQIYSLSYYDCTFVPRTHTRAFRRCLLRSPSASASSPQILKPCLRVPVRSSWDLAQEMFKKYTETKADSSTVSDVKRRGRSGVSVAKARAASAFGTWGLPSLATF